MSTAADDLLAYAIDHVTPADVAGFAPSDPGYRNYVRAFNDILSTRDPPRRATFDITETIGLTRWTDPASWADPVRFRRFRVLTSAVALSLHSAGQADDAMAPNYTVVTLVDDAYALGDQRLLRLSRPALVDCHIALTGDSARSPFWPDETPFVLLGVLLVDAQLGGPASAMSDLADRLMQEEGQSSQRGSFDFLFGRTNFDQLNQRWRWLVDRLVQPATASLSLLRDSILTDTSIRPPDGY